MSRNETRRSTATAERTRRLHRRRRTHRPAIDGERTLLLRAVTRQIDW